MCAEVWLWGRYALTRSSRVAGERGVRGWWVVRLPNTAPCAASASRVGTEACFGIHARLEGGMRTKKRGVCGLGCAAMRVASGVAASGDRRLSGVG